MEDTQFSSFYRDWLSDNPLIAAELWRRAFESGICSEQNGDADAALRSGLVAQEIAELLLLNQPRIGDCAFTRILHSSLLIIRLLRASGGHRHIRAVVGRTLGALSKSEALGAPRYTVIRACERLISAMEQEPEGGKMLKERLDSVPLH
jgi:hypothetical protein